MERSSGSEPKGKAEVMPKMEAERFWENLEPFEALPDRAGGVEVPVPEKIGRVWGSFRMPEPRADRAVVSFNFVETVDGVGSYGLRGFAGGGIISKSRQDRWMMDAYRTMTDAILLGAETIRAEDLEVKRRRQESGQPLPEIDGRPVNGFADTVEDPELAMWRAKEKGERHPPLIILSGSGQLPEDLAVFDLPGQRIIIFTVPAGESKLAAMMAGKERFSKTTVIPLGGAREELPRFVLETAKTRFGMDYILCEGGPGTAGSFIKAGFDDELLTTIAPRLGAGRDGEDRPRKRIFEGPNFFPAEALGDSGFAAPPDASASPEYSLSSVRRQGDHMFLRHWRKRA